MDVHVRYPEEARLIVTDPDWDGHWVVEQQSNGLWRVWTGERIRANDGHASPWTYDFLKEEEVTAQICGAADGLHEVAFVLRQLEEHIRGETEDEAADPDAVARTRDARLVRQIAAEECRQREAAIGGTATFGDVLPAVCARLRQLGRDDLADGLAADPHSVLDPDPDVALVHRIGDEVAHEMVPDGSGAPLLDVLPVVSKRLRALGRPDLADEVEEELALIRLQDKVTGGHLGGGADGAATS